ncbi:hypothetical protein [Pelomonas aquatica]|jgi:hypothetical protein|uniref:Uncharacterized protein n=4 Tax=Pseudomonadota TaxID=1224 RepID=A0A9X4R5S0_9BURK|nr:hypothetical protein [Pelomonas aquatica]MCY4756615.1 hypothetical protein [Pelomonas aquatica]MDG0863970.1 hypothetical protein [Pelomonas aquatica]
MKTFSTTPERGGFVFQMLIAPYKVSAETLADTRGYYGLKLTKHSPFGCVRDEEGHLYAFVRALNAPDSTPNPMKFIYQSSRVDGQTLRIDKARTASQAMTAMPDRGLSEGSMCWQGVPGEEGNAWRIAASGERISWKEEGLFDLSGALMGEGFQWYLPGPEWGMFYVSQLYELQGTCEGRPVKGAMALDQPYMVDGGAIHFRKDPIVNNKKHVAWWSFVTIYKDGTWDTGSFMVGHDHLGYAIFQNEKGEIRTTTDVEARVVHKKESWFAQSVTITVEGQEQWEFLPDRYGEMADFTGGFPVTAQQEGRWRRVGDTREPDRWFGWGESDLRNGTARNVPGREP